MNYDFNKLYFTILKFKIFNNSYLHIDTCKDHRSRLRNDYKLNFKIL